MLRIGKSLILLLVLTTAACSEDTLDPTDPRINSLADLSIKALRTRDYGSQITIEQENLNKPWPSYLASYLSDGLRVYARIDVPQASPPERGFPVIVFVHGWLGIDAAPSMNFFYDDSSSYGKLIDAYVEAGFAVFVPAWRGHGTVNGRPAEGIDFIRAWDNGSYLAPTFYSIDVLNLIDSLQSFAQAPIDIEEIYLYGHSQGGDVALTTLAVAGEGSSVKNEIRAATIWSGNIPSRMTQLRTFWPMQTSPEAFLSGDGSWNGTAIGEDGSVNPNFVFGYPPDWIETPDVTEWSWQIDQWTNATVAEALGAKLEQMYSAINANVADLADAQYVVAAEPGYATEIAHDVRVEKAMHKIGGYDQREFLTETIALHYSDRDFYSFPRWNSELCAALNEGIGKCFDFSYRGNTHSLDVSKHEWFSPAGTTPGYPLAIQRDIALFSGRNPSEIAAD